MKYLFTNFKSKLLLSKNTNVFIHKVLLIFNFKKTITILSDDILVSEMFWRFALLNMGNSSSLHILAFFYRYILTWFRIAKIQKSFWGLWSTLYQKLFHCNGWSWIRNSKFFDVIKLGKYQNQCFLTSWVWYGYVISPKTKQKNRLSGWIRFHSKFWKFFIEIMLILRHFIRQTI